MIDKPEQPEQRFCLCGWSVFDTKEERVNALIVHHLSAEHKRRLEQTGKTVGVEADQGFDV